MKRVFFIQLLFLLTNSVSAQNLVPNPSFEVYNSCPSGQGQLTRCANWFNPTAATPDYYNVCHDTLSGSSHTLGVPNNSAGSQASSQNAYIGIYTFISSIANSREYARTNIPALTPGAVYQVLLKISLAEISLYATNAPDVFFYKNINVDMSSKLNMPRIPQINFSATGNISDMVSWVTLIDTFTADSAYSHLVVGNFRDDANTPKTLLPGSTAVMESYFYIDSISVERIPGLFVTSNNNLEFKVTISPNPFVESTALNVDGVTGNNAIVTIMNVEGRVVRTLLNVGSGSTVISRDGLAPGLYFCQLQTDEGIVWRDKMIVR